MRLIRTCLLFVFLVSFGLPSSAWADETEEREKGLKLLRYLPAETNVVSVVRVRDILLSPYAKTLGKSVQERAWKLGGIDLLPPQVEIMLRATEIHTSEPRQRWEITLVPLPTQIGFGQLAKKEFGTLETIAGRKMFLSHRNAYFVELEPHVVGVHVPATRQQIARWIRDGNRRGDLPLSDYLLESLAPKDHFLATMDLRDFVAPQQVAAWLSHSTILKGQAKSQAEMAAILTGMKGVRLNCQFKDQIHCDISFDFSQDPRSISRFVKPLFLEFLAEEGANLEDLTEADVRVEDQSVILSTLLSASSFRRILSLIQTPINHDHPADTDSNSPEKTVIPAVTVEYYRTIQQMLKDLQQANRQATNYLRTASWHERYARRIEQLSTRGVDPKLVEYGYKIALHLRGLSASLRGVAVELDARQKTLVWRTNVRAPRLRASPWGYYYQGGSYQVNSNLQQVRQQQAAAVVKGSNQREKIWSQINGLHTDILGYLDENYRQYLNQ